MIYMLGARQWPVSDRDVAGFGLPPLRYTDYCMMRRQREYLVVQYLIFKEQNYD